MHMRILRIVSASFLILDTISAGKSVGFETGYTLLHRWAGEPLYAQNTTGEDRAQLRPMRCYRASDHHVQWKPE